MFFNSQEIDYEKNITPFIKNGVIIDTSALLIFFEGLIAVRISNKNERDLVEFKTLNWLIEHLKLEWNKFYITPHILTEVCTNIRNDYCKRGSDFKKIFQEIWPFLNDIIEENIGTNEILKCVNQNNPILEVGDISIFLKADDFVKRNEKTAILAKDFGFSTKYKDDRNVLLFDLHSIEASDIS